MSGRGSFKLPAGSHRDSRSPEFLIEFDGTLGARCGGISCVQGSLFGHCLLSSWALVASFYQEPPG
jgi:hypothetical protein